MQFFLLKAENRELTSPMQDTGELVGLIVLRYTYSSDSIKESVLTEALSRTRTCSVLLMFEFTRAVSKV